MAKDDYAAAGGSLKLKGVKDSKIDKKKKKKKPKQTEARDSASADRLTSADSEAAALAKSDSGTHGVESAEKGDDRDDLVVVGKTEAEKRHDEMRRKRLEERLKREGGLKTHKERVEDLNRYLSNLSEHHDMWVAPALSVATVLLPRLFGFTNSLLGLALDLDNVVLVVPFRPAAVIMILTDTHVLAPIEFEVEVEVEA
ncbi:MAG: hypothetical protein M1819_002637 [Sarea resinae]|nr:MAG: hypothetical protein M1819_002637 [Sarea resinae]